MILDRLSQAQRYAGLHPRFAEALHFLAQPASAELPAGRHPIDGDRLYAMVVRAEGKGATQPVQLEQHRAYIDIQFQAAGQDLIGWTALSPEACSDYDAERDVQFPAGELTARVTVPPGHVAIFFPEDAHAPMLGDGPLHKIVVKVAVKC